MPWPRLWRCCFPSAAGRILLAHAEQKEKLYKKALPQQEHGAGVILFYFF